jgi:plasmid stability protein
MATLTVRNLDDTVVRRLRIRAAEHGRSAEAEHREILRAALIGGEQPPSRQQAADRLAEFRQRIAGRGSPTAAELLAASRSERVRSLAGTDT